MKVKKGFIALIISALMLGACAAQTSEPSSEIGSDSNTTSSEGDTVQVGILHSLSGTMAISFLT